MRFRHDKTAVPNRLNGAVGALVGCGLWNQHDVGAGTFGAHRLDGPRNIPWRVRDTMQVRKVQGRAVQGVPEPEQFRPLTMRRLFGIFIGVVNDEGLSTKGRNRLLHHGGITDDRIR